MGIYYAAYDYKKKEIIHPQGDEAIKWPGILACGNKFAAVVVLANMELENNFKIINDSVHAEEYYNCDQENTDVSLRWYNEYDRLMGKIND